eukprot:TRINITY_DN10884_c0_g2_i4.p1 TRINITY_DN10884_c0_g2~~TRINITY_DN10884_c0_g2_i4.p1  ORF type:complete len:147 (+),score=20.36 TRINITY_DN10884_c0_g2_i4:169-609(+)
MYQTKMATIDKETQLMAHEENNETALSLKAAAGPIMSNMTVGGVAGYCAGTAVKKVSKAVATVVGMSFLALQLLGTLGYLSHRISDHFKSRVLAFNGYVVVNWEKIEGDIRSIVDKDGDGKVDAEFWQTQVGLFAIVMVRSVNSVM